MECGSGAHLLACVCDCVCVFVNDVYSFTGAVGRNSTVTWTESICRRQAGSHLSPPALTEWPPTLSDTEPRLFPLIHTFRHTNDGEGNRHSHSDVGDRYSRSEAYSGEHCCLVRICILGPHIKALSDHMCQWEIFDETARAFEDRGSMCHSSQGCLHVDALKWASHMAQCVSLGKESVSAN